jgi:hypothetical protein
MTIGSLPICYDCANFLPDDDPDEPLKCRAYLDGIPFEIIIGDVDHHLPHLGDHGIQFEGRS